MYTNFQVSFNVLLPEQLIGSPQFDLFVGYLEKYNIRINNKNEECSCKWTISASQVSEFVFLADIFANWILPVLQENTSLKLKQLENSESLSS
jgi:hypothetical protein